MGTGNLRKGNDLFTKHLPLLGTKDVSDEDGEISSEDNFLVLGRLILVSLTEHWQLI